MNNLANHLLVWEFGYLLAVQFAALYFVRRVKRSYPQQGRIASCKYLISGELGNSIHAS